MQLMLPNSQELVLSILRGRLGLNNCIEEMRPEIWDKAIDISIKQRVVLLLYDHLKKTDSNIPFVLMNKCTKYTVKMQ
jgi:hypothetical protein